MIFFYIYDEIDSNSFSFLIFNCVPIHTNPKNEPTHILFFPSNHSWCFRGRLWNYFLWPVFRTLVFRVLLDFVEISAPLIFFSKIPLFEFSLYFSRFDVLVLKSIFGNFHRLQNNEPDHTFKYGKSTRLNHPLWPASSHFQGFLFSYMAKGGERPWGRPLFFIVTVQSRGKTRTLWSKSKSWKVWKITFKTKT